MARTQTKFRWRGWAGQKERLQALVAARPDATLAELRDALLTSVGLSTLWLATDRLQLIAKKPCTPTSNEVLMLLPGGGSGGRGCCCATCASSSSSMNAG